MGTPAAALSPSAPARPGRARHVALWVVQILLAALFGFAGVLKLTTPISELAQKMAWVAQAPLLVRFIGASELAGALGMLLPGLTGIRPRLTALAALGFAVIMVLAMPFHALRGEWGSLPLNAVVLALSLFVAQGRRTGGAAPRA